MFRLKRVVVALALMLALPATGLAFGPTLTNQFLTSTPGDTFLNHGDTIQFEVFMSAEVGTEFEAWRSKSAEGSLNRAPPSS